MPLTKEIDHRARALARLAQQFKGLPRIAALVGLFARRWQDVEDAVFQLYALRGPSAAANSQLDRLGKIVTQLRTSADDATYRLHIQARVRINKSSGTIEQLKTILRLVTPGSVVRVIEGFPAALTVRIENAIVTNAQAAIFLAFLHEARAAGVYATLEYSPQATDDTLTFDSTVPSQMFDAGLMAGVIA